MPGLVSLTETRTSALLPWTETPMRPEAGVNPIAFPHEIDDHPPDHARVDQRPQQVGRLLESQRDSAPGADEGPAMDGP
jgi:hypothetical protein